MGRRLNLSTPTVINTELHPLDESMWIENLGGELDQWYYDNTNQYKPDRSTNPLTLVPKVSASDADTHITYTPTLNADNTKWYVNEWNFAHNAFVEREITSTTVTDDYYKSGVNLVVRKNIPYSHAVSIRCVAAYTDPRDNHIQHSISESVTLTTSRDATPVYPEIDVKCPSAQSFNPLIDEVSIFKLEAWADWSAVAPNSIIPYKAQAGGTEQMLPSNPDIPSVSPIMEIAYGDTVLQNQQFGFRKTANGLVDEIPANQAIINNIKGNTVKWNQLLDAWRLQDQSGTSVVINGITWTKLSDGSIMANGTASGRSQFNIYYDTAIDGFKGVANHKYYGYTVNGDSTYYGTFINNGGGISGNTEKFLTTCTDGTIGSGIVLRVNDSVTVSNVIFKPMLIDLTLIYGAGNAPSTVEQFEADYERWFGKPLSYEEYNEGSLRSVKAETIKTTGFNVWDEEWEEGGYDDNGEKTPTGTTIRCKNAISVIPNTNYVIKIIGARIMAYDINGRCIGRIMPTTNTSYLSFTTPSNCRSIRFNGSNTYGTTYNHDICINISDPAKNGTYEPHWSAQRSLDWISKVGIKNFNIWDEEWVNGYYNSDGSIQDGDTSALRSKNLITVSPNTTYYWYTPYGGRIYYYSADGSFIARTDVIGNGSVFTTPVNCYKIGFNVFSGSSGTTYNHDICINESVEGMNGMYVPYGETAPYFGDGLKYAGSVRDEIKVEDGVVKAIKRVGSRAYVSGDESDTSVITDKNTTTFYALVTPYEYILDLDDIPRGVLEWYGIENDTEVRAETLPWYVSGQHTDELTVDAMRGEEIRIVLRARNDVNGELFPNKAYRTIQWRIPDADSSVVSINGSAVRSDTEEMTFGTVINCAHQTLSDEKKQDNLMINWKSRSNLSDQETDRGWGQEITLDGDILRHERNQYGTLASTIIQPYIYVLGAEEKTTDDGAVVTDDGEEVWDRPLDLT